MHYVIGDVHGCFDELMSMLQRIEETDRDARFILVGDLVDRGPKVWETLSWAMAHITDDGKFQCIMGNHEAQVLEWYRYKFKDWLQSCEGQEAPLPRTKFDFSQMVRMKGLASEEAIAPVMAWLDSLPTRKELELYSVLPQRKARELHRRSSRRTGTPGPQPEPEKIAFKIVHAWYMREITNETMQQHVNIRRRCLTGNPDDSFIIVHGHTPTNKVDFIATDEGFDRPGRICYRANAINVDGGICYGEQNGFKSFLCAICLETGEEFYVS